MEYIFCGQMSSDINQDMKDSASSIAVSGHKFQVNLINGLRDNGQDIAIVNVPGIRFFPHSARLVIRKKSFILDGEERGKSIGYVNIIGVNYFTQYISLKRELSRIIEKKTGEPITLISFNNYLPVVLAMLRIREKYHNVLTCSVIGDLYGSFAVQVSNRFEGVKGRIRTQIGEIQNTLSKHHDAYGLLTKYMAEALEIQNKPFTIIEGIYTDSKHNPQIDDIPASAGKTIIFYAGAVEREYGILHLLNAFAMVTGDEYRLMIAGSGGAVKDVNEFAMKDRRICYLGYISPAEVQQYQQEATVLINPRTSSHNYIKYSFPSKNMECLASGKPYIAHDLICNPEEYREYIQFPTDESDEALARKIMEVCDLPIEERIAIGERAREFILKEKNPQKQCKKIVDMMGKIEQERFNKD